jgi:RNA polymerase sigma-70 factor (ECF subfamily)
MATVLEPPGSGEIRCPAFSEHADRVETADALSARVLRGDRRALAALFALYQPRLRWIVRFRLDPRLRGRIDPDDVLQDAWLRAAARIGSFVTEASGSSFVWFRMIATQALVDLHRRHLGAGKRDASRECSLGGRWSAASTTVSVAGWLAARCPSPSTAAARSEEAGRVADALSRLGDLDREILVLRHFEELTNAEAALVLGLSEQGASARYVRALGRMKRMLESAPGTPPEGMRRPGR